MAIEANSSVLFASFIGSTISVFAREERSLISAIASFLSGVFAGYYLAQVIVVYIAVPPEALAAILAIMGRDLVHHILHFGKDNPLKLFNIFYRLKNPTAPRDEDEGRGKDN